MSVSDPPDVVMVSVDLCVLRFCVKAAILLILCSQCYALSLSLILLMKLVGACEGTLGGLEPHLRLPACLHVAVAVPMSAVRAAWP